MAKKNKDIKDIYGKLGTTFYVLSCDDDTPFVDEREFSLSFGRNDINFFLWHKKDKERTLKQLKQFLENIQALYSEIEAFVPHETKEAFVPAEERDSAQKKEKVKGLAKVKPYRVTKTKSEA
jgi:hypothetical protein